jgi:hypothetical protein
MPTGYTEPVQSGEITELRSFALRVARAFGPLIRMRDDPIDAPTPDRIEPDTEYHDGMVRKSEAKLAELRSLSTVECALRSEADRETRLEERAKSRARRNAERARYQAMLAKVKAWEVPQSLNELKAYMESQLTQSIEHDCHEYPEQPLDVQSGEEWRSASIVAAERDLAYAKKRRAEEKTAVEAANRWLADLYGALPDKV